jgi:hypothetical protein
MATAPGDALEAAMDSVFSEYDQLLRLLDEGALDEVSEARLGHHLQRLDQAQNRLRFLERQVLTRVQRRRLSAAG